MTMPDIITAASLLLLVLSCITACRFYLHMLQLESYYLAGYSHHILKNYLPLALTALCAVACIVPAAVARYAVPAVLALQAATVFFMGRSAHRSANQKKPLAYTGRVKRLLAALTVIFLLLGTGAYFLGLPLCALGALMPAFIPFAVVLAAVMCRPAEYFARQWYINDARRILSEHDDLIIVGITGSYGKTSTKFVLSAILSEKYPVLTPPGNYNTTLGVVRVIRERMKSDDRVFLCEMGSRHVGDIAEICRFVKPDFAIITSIGPQHLETFGSMERLVKGKFELIEAVKPGGAAFFPEGNQYEKQMFDMAGCEKHRYGVGGEGYMTARDVTVSPQGSSFTLVCEDGGEASCTTRLLGAHNVRNIAGCAAVARRLGLSMQEIARGIARLEPVEHRLQIISSFPVTVIDDAYNSSPNGAAAALDVLAAFPGRRIIITPGFVELGKQQNEYHYKMGEQIARSADIAILVGKERTKEIKRGIMEHGGTEVYTEESLSDATQRLASISKAGDTVLFENDLPDNY